MSSHDFIDNEVRPVCIAIRSVYDLPYRSIAAIFTIAVIIAQDDINGCGGALLGFPGSKLINPHRCVASGLGPDRCIPTNGGFARTGYWGYRRVHARHDGACYPGSYRPVDRGWETTVLAFVLLNVAALLRVFGPAWLPAAHNLWVDLAGGLWMLAFAIFAARYGPRLLRPRVDGKPG